MRAESPSSSSFPAVASQLPGRLKLSAGALIGSNLIPLLGVIFLGWSVYFIMILFWLENIIIGGILVMFTGSAAPAIAVLIIVKTVIDLKAHVREHTRIEARA